MGPFIYWEKRQVGSQTVHTSVFFTVTLPKSLVKLCKPKLEMFQRISGTIGKRGIFLTNISQKESTFNCFPSLISYLKKKNLIPSPQVITLKR